MRVSTPDLLVERRTEAPDPDSERWIRDGHRMARSEGQSVFTSIDAKHGAERAAYDAMCQKLKGQGRIVFERRRELDQSLEHAHFDAAQHLKDLAQGRVDLVWALALSVLNAALIVFVLLAFGPSWLAILLALSVLASTLSVEGFFQAYDEKAVFRESVFLTLTILALAAQFWMGTLRGLFLSAIASEIVGPVTETLNRAAPILQVSLGLLALVTECLAGYAWYRVRRQLLSATARAVRERDHLNAQLVALHGVIQRAEREAELRRAYRQIGARRFLASRPTPKQPVERHHLATALRGSFIALIVILLLLLTTNFVFAEPIRTTAVLIDLTKSTTSTSFEHNVRSISVLMHRLPARERIVIVGITNDFGNPQFLLDHVMPAPGYLNLALRAEREGLVARWQKIASGLSPNYSQTDVLGTLSLISHLGEINLDNASLVVYSDLRQSVRFNLESADRIQVSRVLASLKATKSIPRLAGTRVFLLGVDPAGKSAAYFETLKDFWLQFFTEAGAEVRMFSVGRILPLTQLYGDGGQ